MTPIGIINFHKLKFFMALWQKITANLDVDENGK